MEYKTNLNSLMKRLDENAPEPGRLVTENPTPNTQRLWDFLKECYGKRFISGQQYLWKDELEDLVYYNSCGKIPAIRGYDFMGISGLGGGYDQVNRALDWCRSTGGILTMCWHWYAPDDMEDIHKKAAFYYKTTQYDHKTGFDLLRAVEDGTPENEFVLREIDMVSDALRLFEREDFPVLWRPLHEANGNWFWWGNHSPAHIEAYRKLWYIMFDRMMNFHKLTNLIWVWNGQTKDMAVHPNTFDISGQDIYPQVPTHSSQIGMFRETEGFSGGKMLTLSECASIPDPDEMLRDGTKWLWWLPWWGKFVYKPGEKGRPQLDEKGAPLPNPEYMDEEFLRRVFSHESVITLEDLPWRNSSHGLPSALREHLKKAEITLKYIKFSKK